MSADAASDSSKHVVIASSDALLAADMRTQLLTRKDAKFVVDVIAPATPEDRAALVQQVRAKGINGFLWIETAAGKEPAATIRVQSSGDFITDARLGSALNRALVRERLAANGSSRRTWMRCSRTSKSRPAR